MVRPPTNLSTPSSDGVSAGALPDQGGLGRRRHVRSYGRVFKDDLSGVKQLQLGAEAQLPCGGTGSRVLVARGVIVLSEPANRMLFDLAAKK